MTTEATQKQVLIFYTRDALYRADVLIRSDVCHCGNPLETLVV
jgi:hypothetical protein